MHDEVPSQMETSPLGFGVLRELSGRAILFSPVRPQAYQGPRLVWCFIIFPEGLPLLRDNTGTD